MSSFDVGTAFVRVVPDARDFQRLLQVQVDRAVQNVSANVKVSPLVSTAGGAAVANGNAATKQAVNNLNQVEKASVGAASGLASVTTRNKVLQGSLIGLSRVTPVAVFGLGLYGSAAIGAGLAIKGAITSTADFEHQLNIFQGTTNATAADMKTVADEAKSLGADLSLPATSAGDAAVSMTELAKAGLSVQESIAGARGVLQLAAAANISVATSAEFVATELNAFGLAGTEATHIADLLAGASIAAQGSIEDFGAAFQQVSAVARQVNLSVEETTGALTELAKSGLRGADGGTSLRTTLLRLVPTTKQAIQYQNALGIEIDRTRAIGEQLPQILDQYKRALEALNPVQQQEVLTQIAGQDAVRALSILVRGGSEALKANTDAANQSGAASRLAEANARGLSGAFAGLQSNLDTLGITLGSFVSGPLTDVVKGFSEGVGFANDFADALANIKVPFGLGDDLKKLGRLVITAPVRPAQLAFDFLPRPGAKSAAQKAVEAAKKQNEDTVSELARQDIEFANNIRGEGNRAENDVKAAFEKALGIHDESGGSSFKSLTEKQAAAVRARVAALNKTKDEAFKGLVIPRSLQQNLVDAQLADSLQQELSADNKIVAFFEKRLKGINENTNKYLVVSGQLRDAQAQRDSVVDQIASDDAASAAKQKEAADKAIQAEKDRAAAQEQLRQTILDIQTQRIDNQIAAAAATKGIADDQKAFENKRKLLLTQRKHQEDLIKEAKGNRQKVADARKEIARLDGQLNQLARDLGNLGKDAKSQTDSGGSMIDIFREAVDQFNTFGSNIAGRNGILSGQDARGSLSAVILGKDANLTIQGAQLTQAEKQTQLLELIYGSLNPVSPQGRRINSAAALDRLQTDRAAQLAANYNYGSG